MIYIIGLKYQRRDNKLVRYLLGSDYRVLSLATSVTDYEHS